MDITVYQAVEWDQEITLRDAPYGDNSVGLKPLQLDLLLQEGFLAQGGTATLPQPDASYSCCTVIYHPGHSWHFLQEAGRELIIAEAEWPAIRQACLALYTPRRAPHPTLTAPDDALIFAYKHRCEELSHETIAQLLSETGYTPHDARDAAFTMARWAYYQRSRAEAQRLGLTPHPTSGFLHNPIALIEEAVGDAAGQALAQRHGFTWRDAGSMWDVIGERREGDAVVAFIGDDRGWAPQHTYWIAVAWSPAHLAEAFGYTPGLV